VGPDPCPSAALRNPPFIGRGFDFAQIGENVLRKFQRFQTTSPFTIFFGNQPVCADKVLDFVDMSQLAS
jgi:hypothetical protein